MMNIFRLDTNKIPVCPPLTQAWYSDPYSKRHFKMRKKKELTFFPISLPALMKHKCLSLCQASVRPVEKIKLEQN
jgi:hypothetical protein